MPASLPAADWVNPTSYPSEVRSRSSLKAIAYGRLCHRAYQTQDNCH
ncbi:MAG: hypothetical protein AAGL17_01355 [Cyanobacteria bacterium J06576_12]